MTMHICYYDHIGIVDEQINEFGVSFADGYAYFEVGEESRKIPATNIIHIYTNINE